MSATTVQKEGPPLGTLHEVCATFGDPAAMQDAVARLETSGFDRADLSLPEVMPSAANATPEAGAKPADTEQDARQARTLHVSAAAAAVALAAGAIAVATGASIALAIVAAVVGAAAAGGIAYLFSSVANEGEQIDREVKAAAGALVLSVRTPTTEKRSVAEAILLAAGGRELEVR